MRRTAPRPVTEIDLVELRAVVDRLLDHVIETRGVRTLALEDRYYWEVPALAKDLGKRGACFHGLTA